MRILIDLSPLPRERQFRGSGRYIEQIVHALRQHKGPEEIVVAQQAVSNTHIDVVHYPFFDCFYPTLPLMHRARAVVTIHDVIPLEYPQQYPKGVRGTLVWQRQKQALRTVQHVITDAPSTVSSISQHTGIPSKKITPVPLAVSEVFGKHVPKTVLDRIRNRYLLPAKFILYVGDGNWNKNVPFLVETAMRAGLPLVLVGGIWRREPGTHSEEGSIRAVLGTARHNPQLLRVGHVSDEDLAGIYTLATVYVQPSFAEGFSFPVLEAMTIGCPVVISDIPAHRDLAQDAAFYFDPNDGASLTDNLHSLWNMEPSRKLTVVTHVRKRAETFSWTKTARETLAVYRKAAHAR